MKYRVSHNTTYAYEDFVSISHNEARLTPRRTARQTTTRTQFLIEPAPAELVTETDYFGNVVSFFSIEESHARLAVTAVSEVDVSGEPPPDASGSAPWEVVRNNVAGDRTRAGLEALGYTFESPFVTTNPDVAAYARESFAEGRPVLEAAAELTKRVHADFRYEQGTTSIATPVADVMRARRGVCQDFAHLEIAMLRGLGLPVRYVSGYVRTRSKDGETDLVGGDASHAWLAVYAGELGYIDLDPTNGTLPTDEHVTLAWGRDFGDVSPLKGVILGGGRHSLSVNVDVAVA
jgi:transglutaminase-like putative cysteine protease